MSKRKTVALVLITALLFPLAVFPAGAVTQTASRSGALSVSAQSAILIEAESGAVVWAKNADARLPMASTTKIMTAWTALQHADPSLPVTVDPAAVGIEGSSVYLSAGEQLTLGELLDALMLESANDAAIAIAIAVGGSVEQFADLMNAEAEKLGLTNTHFVNPNGLDDPAHYTTSRELAAITRQAMQNETFRSIVSTRKMTIPHAGTDGVRLLVNHNKMLRLYDGCVGVKTGFTKKSGRCLVSAATRGGVTLIAVTLNAPDDWNDHTNLLDYGFSRYESVLLCEKGGVTLPLLLTGGTAGSVTLTAAEELRLTLPASRPDVIKTVETRAFEFAPVACGDICGEIVFRCDLDRDGIPEIIGKVPLTACESVEKKSIKKGFFAKLRGLFGF